MTILAIILLILLGIVLLLLEFAVIPGVTIAGIGGFLALIGSIFIAFSTYGKTGGLITLVFILLISPVLVYYFFKSKSARKIILSTEIDGKVDSINNQKIGIGATGKTIGRLAPSGKVKVNGEVVEAQSTGQFIDENKKIKVVKILMNKIIVEPVNQN